VLGCYARLFSVARTHTFPEVVSLLSDGPSLGSPRKMVEGTSDVVVTLKVDRTLAPMEPDHAGVLGHGQRAGLELALAIQALLVEEVEAETLSAIIQGLGCCEDDEHGSSFQMLWIRFQATHVTACISYALRPTLLAALLYASCNSL
jgi:hypothetical protein